MTFDAPLILLLAPVVGSLFWAVATWVRRVRLSHAARWSAETARLARAGGRFGPTAISVAAFLCTVALAGPRWGRERLEAETRGLNLVMAVDISRSMLAEDAGGSSRLARALREARRLTQDLDGDRLGLVAFAGASYILSPLSVDGSALTLYLDALDPDVASEGGTSLAPALEMGGELLATAAEAADRILVVFTDAEGHDSLAATLDAAQRLRAAGVHVIFVAEGGRDPARIPRRDDQGVLQGYQVDDAGQIIETRRRDDVLITVSDAAHGTIVDAGLADQAGAVRDLVASYKRSRSTQTSTESGRPRGWVPLLGALAVLFAQGVLRRTAALVGLCLALLSALPADARAQAPLRRRTPAERAWDRGESARARDAYLAQLAVREDDTTWYNAGTAAVAAGDFATARSALAKAAVSLDPGVRFRALFNEGLLALRAAELDTVHRDAHLGEAERAYREALLLQPRHPGAKWNLELAQRRRSQGGGSGQPPPSSAGQSGPSQTGSRPPPPSTATQGMSQSQADEILRSIGQEELNTRRQRMGRVRRASEPGMRDW
ncbi:MAG TPA: VWA domain-containing protein [Gemmatimonadales bacterium]|nr:VWA domain-containing protein [Gemmatimonadales bacterium]